MRMEDMATETLPSTGYLSTLDNGPFYMSADLLTSYFHNKTKQNLKDDLPINLSPQRTVQSAHASSLNTQQVDQPVEATKQQVENTEERSIPNNSETLSEERNRQRQSRRLFNLEYRMKSSKLLDRRNYKTEVVDKPIKRSQKFAHVKSKVDSNFKKEEKNDLNKLPNKFNREEQSYVGGNGFKRLEEINSILVGKQESVDNVIWHAGINNLPIADVRRRRILSASSVGSTEPTLSSESSMYSPSRAKSASYLKAQDCDYANVLLPTSFDTYKILVANQEHFYKTHLRNKRVNNENKLLENDKNTTTSHPLCPLSHLPNKPELNTSSKENFLTSSWSAVGLTSYNDSYVTTVIDGKQLHPTTDNKIANENVPVEAPIQYKNRETQKQREDHMLPNHNDRVMAKQNDSLVNRTIKREQPSVNALLDSQDYHGTSQWSLNSSLLTQSNQSTRRSLNDSFTRQPRQSAQRSPNSLLLEQQSQNIQRSPNSSISEQSNQNIQQSPNNSVSVQPNQSTQRYPNSLMLEQSNQRIQRSPNSIMLEQTNLNNSFDRRLNSSSTFNNDVQLHPNNSIYRKPLNEVQSFLYNSASKQNTPEKLEEYPEAVTYQTPRRIDFLRSLRPSQSAKTKQEYIKENTSHLNDTLDSCRVQTTPRRHSISEHVNIEQPSELIEQASRRMLSLIDSLNIHKLRTVNHSNLQPIQYTEQNNTYNGHNNSVDHHVKEVEPAVKETFTNLGSIKNKSSEKQENTYFPTSSSLPALTTTTAASNISYNYSLNYMKNHRSILKKSKSVKIQLENNRMYVYTPEYDKAFLWPTEFLR